MLGVHFQQHPGGLQAEPRGKHAQKHKFRLIGFFWRKMRNVPGSGPSCGLRKDCALPMADVAGQNVFVVDDEVTVLDAIGRTLETLGVEVTCFINPAQCLEGLRLRRCDLLIADLRMPEMDGIELLREVKRHKPWVPVLVVTGYGDVPSAVRAIKAGAEDFVEKPLDKANLRRIVESILQESHLANASLGRPLTQIQAKILKLIVNGKNNKEIAGLLGRSVRTVEVHRSHMMEKLGVTSLIGLVKRAAALGLVDLTPGQKPEKRAGGPERD